MIYYDYDLEGEYQSTERALSFIHAMKEVLSDYDDAPNLADEWRCLLPFNDNGTTRYFGHCLINIDSKVIIENPFLSKDFRFSNMITSLEETIYKSTYYYSMTAYIGNTSNGMEPLKYLRVYSLDGGKVFTWFTTDEINDRNNNVYTTNNYAGNKFNLITFIQTNNKYFPVFSTMDETYCYGVPIENTPTPVSYQTELVGALKLYKPSKSDDSNAYNTPYIKAMIDTVTPEFNSGDYYSSNITFPFLLPEFYTYNDSYSGFRYVYKQYVFNELKAIYTDGSIGISCGNTYKINNVDYIPICPEKIDVLTEGEYVNMLSIKNRYKRNTILMIPVGTKGN